MKVQTLNANEFVTELKHNRDLFIVDLRTQAEVANECMENCIHLPLQDLCEENLQQQLQAKNRSSDTPIYLLCQSGRRATMAIEKLGSSHNFSLVILDGGLNAIKKAGGSTASSPNAVISLERQVRIIAGLLVLIGLALGFWVNTYFYFLSVFVGLGLSLGGMINLCPLALLLARMPWNKA